MQMKASCLLVVVTLCQGVSDKPAMSLVVGQTAALVADGITTRQIIIQGGVEKNPVARVLIGERPTWGRMIPVGVVEVIGAFYLGQKMRHSNNRVIRRLWWVPQVLAIAGHSAAAIHNDRLLQRDR